MSAGLTPVYHPLESELAIRFLKLLPGEANDEICFELIYDSLAQAPPRPYEATSYTWGSPLPVRTVRCDGRAVEIRENAHDFLHRLRLPKHARLLWMDCLCIDQSNISERAEQVKIMHLIYRRAQCVLIWLGQEGDDSAICMAYARQLDARKCVEEVARGNAHAAIYNYKTYHSLDGMLQTAENERLVRSIAAIFNRSWLRRVWVQQEAAMCADTRVFCGADEIHWDSFFSLAWLVQGPIHKWPSWTAGSSYILAQAGAESICNLQYNRISIMRPVDPWTLENLADENKQRWLASHGRPTDFRSNELEQQVLSAWERDLPGPFANIQFQKLALRCSGLEATDPRDKVYALFNLTTIRPILKENEERPKVDYSVPWQVVYIRVAKWLYDWKYADILGSAGRSNQYEANLPSWVPDWRRKIEVCRPYHPEWSAGGAAYQPYIRFLTLPKSFPDAESLPRYSYVDGNGKTKRIPGEGLELTAVLQDRIAYVGSDRNWQSERLSQNISQHQDRLAADLRYLEKNEPRYFTGEQAAHAYAATLIMNTTHEGQLASPEYEREGFAEYQRWLNEGVPDPDPVYFDAIAGYLRENAFCVTTHGLMACTPDFVQVGDYIVILSGFKDPFVLRKVGPKDGRYYELLDICYVHRMMRSRVWGLIEDFKCKYQPGSEDEDSDFAALETQPDGVAELEEPCDSFPFNPKAHYQRVVRVLGTRRIVIV